jgi:hypothetical protein
VPDILGAVKIFGKNKLMSGACLMNVTVNRPEVVTVPHDWAKFPTTKEGIKICNY